MPRKYKKHKPITVGDTRERLVVTGGPLKRNGKYFWICDCKCGSTDIEIRDDGIKSGHATSCGCLHRELAATLGRSKKIHGESGRSVEYQTWASMNSRAANSNRKDYERYGGKGIDVCVGWRDSFSSFLEILGRRPSAEHSIDRINNTGGYWCGQCRECREKGYTLNCRWATKLQQSQNKSNNLNITIGNITLCQREWERSRNLPFGIIYARLKAGWPVDETLIQPPRSARVERY